MAAVHLALIDASGTIREKRLGPAATDRAFDQGWRFIDAIEWWDSADHTWRAPEGSVDARSHRGPRQWPALPLRARCGLLLR